MPYFAGEQPGDRNPVRLAVTLVVGAIAALVGLAVAGLIGIAGFTWVAEQLAPGGAAQPVPINDLLAHPELAQGSLRLSLALIVMIPLTTAGAVLAFLLVSKLILKRPMLSYFTEAARFRWVLVGFGLLANVLLFAPMVVFENWAKVAAGAYPLAQVAPTAATGLFFIAVNLVFLFVGALAEEVLFRGWLLRHVKALVRSPWAAIGLTAVIFAVAHGEFSSAPLIALAIMGAGFTWMTVRTGGIELAVGVHTANNLMLALFQGPPGLPQGSDWSLTPGNLMDFGVTAASYLAITEVAVRLFPPAARAPAEPPASAIAAFE
ncbi:MAG: Abortive infection protein [Caulobacter sp.]|nr:Abortive infection protein [Caulobacter sp.]